MEADVLTCSQHHGWIAGVGAAGDGSNDHRAMSKSEFAVVVDKGLVVIVMVWSNLKTLKSLLWEGKVENITC